MSTNFFLEVPFLTQSVLMALGSHRAGLVFMPVYAPHLPHQALNCWQGDPVFSILTC